MNNFTPADTTSILLNNRTLTGFISSPDDYYWSCKNIFECDLLNITYNDVKALSADDIPDGTFIYFPCSLQTYQYCNTISIAHSAQKIHFRLFLLFKLAEWQSNINLLAFLTSLNEKINKTQWGDNSILLQDVSDYSVELEFTGNLNESMDVQIQRVLTHISVIHDDLVSD